MATVAQFLTPTITKLELLCNGLCIGNATGFFMKKGEGWSIATNWHVLSGRDPLDGQPRHKAGAVPDAVRYLVFRFVGDKGQAAWKTAPLGDALAGNPTWLQHPTHGQSVDVAVLPLPDADVGLAKDFYDPTGYDPEMMIDLGGELFLPGYPLGFTAPGGFAIWKRASLASSLEFGEGIDNFCYVDTATREGMSGSPCLAVSNWRHYRLDRKTGKVAVIEQPISSRLVGVYSGRRNPSDSFEAQIGIVWREPLLKAILQSGVPASVIIR